MGKSYRVLMRVHGITYKKDLGALERTESVGDNSQTKERVFSFSPA